MICHPNKFIHINLGYTPPGFTDFLRANCAKFKIGTEDFITKTLNTGKFNDYFTFAFITNPFSRCLVEFQKSGYNHVDEFIKELKNTSLPSSLTPFCEKIRDMSLIQPIDYIAKTEFVVRDCKTICEKASLPSFSPAPLSLFGDIGSFNEESIQIIKDLFHEDFLHFYPNYIHYSDEFETPGAVESQNEASAAPTIHQELDALAELWPQLANLPCFSFFSAALASTRAGEAYECFNPNQDLAVVSLYTPETEHYGHLTEDILKLYCLRHNYTLHIYRRNLNTNSFPNWSKAKALLNHLEGHKWVTWIDSDAFPINLDKKLEHFTDKYSRKHFVLSKDFGTSDIDRAFPLNTGVIFCRNTSYSSTILGRLNQFSHDHKTTQLFDYGSDQGVLSHLLKKSDPIATNYKLCEMSEFNTDPRNVTPETFIIHFMNFPPDLKHLFIKYLHFQLTSV